MNLFADRYNPDRRHSYSWDRPVVSRRTCERRRGEELVRTPRRADPPNVRPSVDFPALDAHGSNIPDRRHVSEPLRRHIAAD
jgi:hypothetical protein